MHIHSASKHNYTALLYNGMIMMMMKQYENKLPFFFFELIF